VRRVVLSPDAHGWSPEPEQLDLFGTEIPDGLYTTKDFERVVSLLTRTDAAAKHLTAYLRATDRMAKTVVFCVNQEHADHMRRALHNANSDLTAQHPDYVVRIVSDEGIVGDAHLGRFADTDSDTPVIATTSSLLSTGVDLPTVRNIVLFRPVGSMALFKQMIGRGTRIFLDDGKLSFDIIDYAGATALFEDPDFDGPPESVVEEEIDDEGEPVDETVVASPEPPFETPEDVHDDVDPDDLEEEPRAKYYVDDVEVWVTAEAVYHLDPETERLRLVEYRDFVADTVRSLYPDPNHLRACWRSRPGRQDVLDALAERGIDAGELAERTGLTEADPLDMLVHLAWNQPLATRTDRARRVRKERSDFFEQYSPAARDVLKALLDKYADHGIGQLDDLSVLGVQPLAALGTPTEIASRFGSSAKLRAAVTRLGELLYAS
jgi:type I restriction enzyme R subunit